MNRRGTPRRRRPGRSTLRLRSRQPLRDLANQLSVIVVVAVCLAAITVSSTRLAHHYGLTVPIFPSTVADAGHPAPATTHLDPDTASEAGLAENIPDPAVAALQTATPDANTIKRSNLAKGTFLPILMYHYIREVPKSDRAGFALSVATVDFTEQMRYLKNNGFTTLTMRDVDMILMGRKAAPPKPVALTFDDGYADFYTTAAPILHSFGLTATNYVPTQLVGDSNGAYMTWAEIQQLDVQGFEMAAHSQFHVDVSKVNAARARIEIFGAKADLEQHLGHGVVDWAYPYGGYDLAALTLVHDAGYWSAATTVFGSYHDAAQMPLLSRVRVAGGETTKEYEAHLVAR
jgi:peptidoglycan/xylan/chitin deacetylase (PgdA/CDA1 family)